MVIDGHSERPGEPGEGFHVGRVDHEELHDGREAGEVDLTSEAPLVDATEDRMVWRPNVGVVPRAVG
jgi:hypothetical protein